MSDVDIHYANLKLVDDELREYTEMFRVVKYKDYVDLERKANELQEELEHARKDLHDVRKLLTTNENLAFKWKQISINLFNALHRVLTDGAIDAALQHNDTQVEAIVAARATMADAQKEAPCLAPPATT